MMARRLLLLCTPILLGLGSAHAQNYLYATGSPTFSSQIPIENGSINVNNGDIHLEIPLAQTAQRGRLALNERLIYDSRIWKIVQNGAYSWQPTNVPNSLGGWLFSSGAGTGSISFSTQTFTWFDCAGNSYTGSAYYAFTWKDPQGTSHLFNGQTIEEHSPPVKCNNTHYDTPNGSGTATDGSGYSIKITNYQAVSVYDKQGTLVSGPNFTDTNGNEWSTDANGNLVDTDSRTPVWITTSGNLTYYDVLAEGGSGRNRYTVTTATVYYSTSFGEQPVNEASGSFTAIQSIALPDGSAYSFRYDSGMTAGHYGDLTSITLPTGGVITYTYVNYLDSFNNKNRWVNTRVRDGGTTTFTPAVVSACSSSQGCQERVKVTTPDQNDTVYTFTLDKGALANAGSWNSESDVWQGSSTSGGTKLQSKLQAYTYSTSNFATENSSTNFYNSVTYQVPSSVTTNTVLPDVSLTSQSVTTNPGTAPADTKVWDYYPSSGSAPSSPTKETVYSYSYGSSARKMRPELGVCDASLVYARITGSGCKTLFSSVSSILRNG